MAQGDRKRLAAAVSDRVEKVTGERDRNYKPVKRLKVHEGPLINPSSVFSDETMIHIFTYLDESDLSRCNLVCAQWKNLISEPSIWRRLYHERFVNRKVRQDDGRLPFRDWLRRTREAKRARSTDKSSDRIDWKLLYRTRHNWARGRCLLRTMSDQEDGLDRMAKMGRLVGDAAIIASQNRLCWHDTKSTMRMIGQYTFRQLDSTAVPTALQVSRAHDGRMVVLVAYQGQPTRIGIWANGEFVEGAHSVEGLDGVICFALEMPYLMVQYGDKSVNFFNVAVAEDSVQVRMIPDARFSVMSWSCVPCALSIRHAEDSRDQRPDEGGPKHMEEGRDKHEEVKRDKYTGVLVCAEPTISGDTKVFLQEWELSQWQVHICRSWLCGTCGPAGECMSSGGLISTDIASRLSSEFGTSRKVECISFAYPYLLLGWADNTLTLHVLSKDETGQGRISYGRTLWGHTSGIQQACIDRHGNAVTIASQELRVWQFQQFQGVPSRESNYSVSCTRIPIDDHGGYDWIGFDQERIALSNFGYGLLVYDFTM